jgi:phage shock protein PspC (stress-responsive transcriptional regulator)
MLMVMSGADDADSTGGQQDRRPTGSAGVEETLRDFWATRPRRSRRGRKIAGVATGIGLRYGIDPIVVRVAFAVTAFYGGAGVLLYLLGWLLLPQDDDEVSPVEGLVGKGRSSTSAMLTVILALALIPASSGLMRGDIDAFIAAGLAAGALFLLHRYRGQRPAGSPAVSAAAAGSTRADSVAAAAGSATPQATETTVGEGTAAAGAGSDPLMASAPDQRPPPSWDPLGAAPFAWDLPDPGKPTEPVRRPEPVLPRRRSGVTAATIGLALVVGGLCVLLAPYSGGWLTPRHGVGLVLAVIGLGLVAGLFLRGGRGLVWLAIPLAVAGLALRATSADHWAAGNQQWHPVSVRDVHDTYQLTVGDLTLDLSQLHLNGNTVTTQVNLGAGNARVLVPRDVRVEANCQTGVGDVNCLDHHAAGPGAATRATADAPADRAGGGQIVLDVQVGTGKVEVTRG